MGDADIVGALAGVSQLSKICFCVMRAWLARASCKGPLEFWQYFGQRLADRLFRLPAVHADRVRAEGFSTVTSPRAPMPITAAGTPESAASVKTRRSSIRWLAATSRFCCSRSSEVILLKVSPRWAGSPSAARTGTWT